MPLLPSAKPAPWDKPAYRNIYTCHPAQDLFDDLGLDEKQKALCRDFENQSSLIDHSAPQKDRAFQYGDLSATPQFHATGLAGRYNDATFGTWYGALEGETSETETLYWFYRFNRERLRHAHGSIVSDRVMFKTRLKGAKFVDLRKADAETRAKITHPTDYSYTHACARLAREMDWDAYVTPSVRRAGGSCVSAFHPRVIREEKKVYYLRYTLTQEHKLFKSRTEISEEVAIPEVWDISGGNLAPGVRP